MIANSQRSRKAGNGVGDVWAPIPRRGHRGRWLASSAPHRRRLPQTRAVLDQKHLGERRARPGLSRGAPLRPGGGLPRGLGRPPPPPDFPASEASTASCLTEAFAARLPRVRDPAEDQGPRSPPGPSGLPASGKIPQPLSLMTLTFVEEHSPFFFFPFK